MKKIFISFLTLLLILALAAGCGNAADNAGSGPASNTGETSGGNGNKISEKTLAEIADAIYAKKTPDLPLATNEVDISNADMLKYNTGLSNADKIKEAVVSESRMGSQAYSLVLARCKSSSDMQAVAQEMKSGIDTRKWICVEADDLKVAAADGVVMLIMVDSGYADTVTAQEIVNAFKEIAGTLSVEL